MSDLNCNYFAEGFGSTKSYKTNPPPVDFESMWQDLLVDSEPEHVNPLITIRDRPVMTPENHSLVIGKKKARKTLLCTWLLTQLSGDHEHEIIIFDTEQGKKHLYKVYERLKKLTGGSIKVFFLRGKSPAFRRDFIAAILDKYKGSVRLILIDGIRDLLKDINNPTECTELVEWMENLIVAYKVHIINVLHCNKNDDNARGHLGTELTNKAETTISVRLSTDKTYSTVSCEDSRDEPFESFTIRHSDDHMPLIDWDIQKGKKRLTEAEEWTLLKRVFSSALLSYAEVIEKFQAVFGIGANAAVALLKSCKARSIVVVQGKSGTKNAKYRLAEPIPKDDQVAQVE